MSKPAKSPKYLLIDNYDSFTYNLVHLFQELGAEVIVRRNDELDADDAERLAPSHLVVSPGPGRPADSGATVEIVRRLAPTTPTLGVCLGHQAIGQHFGGRVARAPRVMHGKVSDISHDGSGVFASLPSPFTATRYHSLALAPDRVPDCLTVNAHAPDGSVQGVRHRALPIHGVQFHPESIASEHGHALLANFLTLAAGAAAAA